MIEGLPNWISIIFLVVAIFTIVFFHITHGNPKKLTLAIVVIGVIQSLLAYSSFYLTLDGFPPRIAFILLPNLVLIIYGCLPKQIEWVVKNRNTNLITFLHTIRIPVEIVLLYLFLNGAVPELMSFHGRNFDILAGTTAPIIGFLFYKGKMSRRILLIWNFLGLGLILFILVNGIFSVPTPFQQFGFDQPNIALLYFPFVLLPAIVVPIVIYTHLSEIIRLKQDKVS